MSTRKKIVFLIILNSICCFSQIKQGLVSNKAMVVSAREEASKIGVEILKKGGNAFDAMIATELALAVAYPQAGNIGGGGFMVYRKYNGEVGSLDYREVAPLQAHKKMYLDQHDQVIQGLSTNSAFSIGVPGTIAGIFEVHKKFGSLPLEDIFLPVINLCRNGIKITKKQSKILQEYRDEIISKNGSESLFSKLYIESDTIKQFQLAKTLERILNNGKNEFYEGEIADKLVKYINDKGGILTLQDLKEYKAVWRNPVQFNYKKYKIITMAPPSSGGITLGQILKMIEKYPLSKYGHNSMKTIQVIVEAERRAYADRNFYLGDPDFVKIPQNELLDKKYLNTRMRDFTFNKATPSTSINSGKVTFDESTETTHYSIVDQYGNAVSATTTLNDNFGSKYYCEELGFFLNNQMDDFSAKPGVPNMYGLIGNEANSIYPKKRMLSSMTPTIIEKNKKLYMVLGTPGGSTIITSVLQTFLNVVEFNMSMQEAVNAPRFHHQWLPDNVVIEPNKFSKTLIDDLVTKGYNISEKSNRIIGKVDAVLILPNGKIEGGADERGDDKAVGF